MGNINATNVKSISFTVPADPAGDKGYPFWVVPEGGIHPIGYSVVSLVADDGTNAVQMDWRQYGTAGTAVEGTVTGTLGGTAVASRLSASVPQYGSTINDQYLPESYVIGPYLNEIGDWQSSYPTATLYYLDGSGGGTA